MGMDDFSASRVLFNDTCINFFLQFYCIFKIQLYVSYQVGFMST